MSYSLLVNTGKIGGIDSTVTDAIDTSGANLIVIGLAWYSGTTDPPTLSDSKTNTWSGLTAVQASGGANLKSRLYYCFNPTVGTGHTFTSTGTSTYAVVFVQAFSGSVSSPFDQQNGAAGGGSESGQTGSVTPSEDNEVLVSVTGCLEAGATFSINSSFTLTNQVAKDTTTVAGAMAYKIQTSLGAENPTWTWTGTANSSAVIATFKAAAAGGSAIPVFLNQYRQRWG